MLNGIVNFVGMSVFHTGNGISTFSFLCKINFLSALVIVSALLCEIM